MATLGTGISFLEGATLKELRLRVNRNTSQPLRGCEQSPRTFLNPGFQSKPWADVSQRFQRYQVSALTHEFATFRARPQHGEFPLESVLLWVPKLTRSRRNTMADEKKTCKNPVCGCPPSDGDYCSASCEGTGDTIELDCDCSHEACQGNF